MSHSSTGGMFLEAAAPASRELRAYHHLSSHVKPLTHCRRLCFRKALYVHHIIQGFLGCSLWQRSK